MNEPLCFFATSESDESEAESRRRHRNPYTENCYAEAIASCLEREKVKESQGREEKKTEREKGKSFLLFKIPSERKTREKNIEKERERLGILGDVFGQRRRLH